MILTAEPMKFSAWKDKEYYLTVEGESSSESNPSSDRATVKNPCDVTESSWKSPSPPCVEENIENWYLVIWFGKRRKSLLVGKVL